MAVKTFTVTVVSTAGGNKYFIDGVQQATVALARGATYRFDQSDSSNATHPLVFSSDAANYYPYTTGVTTAGTPGSGGAYTEIAVATSAPAYLYYYCSNHAGMGGAASVTSDSFGALTWSANSWGSINNTISVTGIGASLSLGDETTQANSDAAVTGIALTTSVNNVGDIVIATTGNPTGIAMTTNLGTADPEPDSEVNGIAMSASTGTLDAFNLEGWGRKQWNTFAWGITGSLITTGQAATANTGTLSAEGDANVTPTGIAMSANVATLPGVEISFEIELTGFAVTTNLGTADAGPDAMLTGIGATASLGTLDAYNQTGWGRQQWNVNAWGVEGQFANVLVTGVTASSNVGTLAATGDAEVIPTGIGLTATEGTVDPSPDATVTGIGMTASLAVGTVIAGEANVTVLGQGISMGLGVGTLDAVSLIDVTGISMSANINGVTTTGSAAVPLTGIELTSTLNNANTLIWNEINTGSTAIWTEVPTRAA